MDMIVIQLGIALLGLIGILTLVFGLKNLLTVNQFTIGAQTRKVSTTTYKKPNKKSKEKTEKELEKEREQIKIEQEYLNTANRIGISVPYKQAISMLMVGIFLMLILSFLTLIIGLLVLSFNLLNIVITIAVIIVVDTAIYLTIVKPYGRVWLKKKEATRDMQEELALLLSIMKNSKEDNINSIFKSFTKSCNILKVDMQILLQDINVYGMKEALTKFGDKLNNPIATQFTIAVKSVLDATVAQRSTTLSLVEKDIQKSIQDYQLKEGIRLTRIMNLVIVGIFVSGLLIVMASIFGEVSTSLSTAI